MNELSLFAGAGGGVLAAHLMGWKTVCAVEIEDYPRRVLLARQKDGLLPRFPIWDNVTTFDGKPWKGRIDIITGGFPCQDISCAGKGEGITGKRSGLWSEMARIIGEVRPQYAFMENSPMLVRRGLAVVISDLAEMGYACKWGIIGAHHAGGPHKRDRIWILANASDQGLQRRKQQAIFPEGRGQERGTATQCSCSWWGLDPADISDTKMSNDKKHKRGSWKVQSGRKGKTDKNTPAFTGLGGMAYELADRMDILRTAFGGEVPRVGVDIKDRVSRLKAIGNGQVPMAHNLAVKMLAMRK